MEYVMVPVPAEHEQELLREVMRMSLRDIAHRWDEASAAKVDLAISPELRVLVRRICIASVAGTGLTAGELCSPSMPSEADVLAAVEQLNDHGRSVSQPVFVMVEAQHETGPEGEARTRTVLGLSPRVAGLFLALDESGPA